MSEHPINGLHVSRYTHLHGHVRTHVRTHARATMHYLWQVCCAFLSGAVVQSHTSACAKFLRGAAARLGLFSLIPLTALTPQLLVSHSESLLCSCRHVSCRKLLANDTRHEPVPAVSSTFPRCWPPRRPQPREIGAPPRGGADQLPSLAAGWQRELRGNAGCSIPGCAGRLLAALGVPAAVLGMEVGSGTGRAKVGVPECPPPCPGCPHC